MSKDTVIQIVGITGCLLFFVKLFMHVYLIRVTDKKYSFKNIGAFTDPMLFLPVIDVAGPRHKIVKIVANVCYTVFVVCMGVVIINRNVG